MKILLSAATVTLALALPSASVEAADSLAVPPNRLSITAGGSGILWSAALERQLLPSLRVGVTGSAFPGFTTVGGRLALTPASGRGLYASIGIHAFRIGNRSFRWQFASSYLATTIGYEAGRGRHFARASVSVLSALEYEGNQMVIMPGLTFGIRY